MLQNFISRLKDIQAGLTKVYQKDAFLKNKLFNAVKEIEARKLAYYKRDSDMGAIIADLNSSLPPMLEIPTPVLDAHLVDRKFRGDCYRKDSRNKSGECFFSQRKGCWPTIYTNKEKIAALRKKSFRQFITSIVNNDDKSDKEEEFVDQLKEFVAHVIEFGVDGESFPTTTPSASIARIDSYNSLSVLWHRSSNRSHHAVFVPTSLKRSGTMVMSFLKSPSKLGAHVLVVGD